MSVRSKSNLSSFFIQDSFFQFLATVLDLLLIALFSVWLAGGVPWRGHWILRHGADLRRTALIIGTLGWFSVPIWREQSLILHAVEKAFEGLYISRVRWALLGVVILWACAVGVLQATALRYPLMDVGSFHEIIWAVAHGHGFLSTIGGAGDFLKDHFSPSLTLLVPFFWISASSPIILPVLHCLLLFGGASAWIYLAERLPQCSPDFRNRLAAATTIFIISFESFWGNLHWGFHENAIGFASLSWAYALIFSGEARSGIFKKSLPLALFAIAAFSKEIFLLNVAVAFVVWMFQGRFRSSEKVVLAVFALALIFVFIWFEKVPHPADKNYFDRYYAYLGRGLGEFLKTIFLNPFRAIQAIGGRELFQYGLIVFFPWLFLPFLGRRIWLLAILPSLASAAFATYPPLRRTDFHYVLELWPVLAALTLTVFAKLNSERWIWVWAWLAVFALDHDPWQEFVEFSMGSWRTRAVRAAFLAIPESATVAADELAGTWLAGRKVITRFPDLRPFPCHCPDWFVLQEATALREDAGRCGIDPQKPQWKVADWKAYLSDPEFQMKCQ